MFLPVEVIEQITSYFLNPAQQKNEYFRALKTISLLSPYFFERMRYVRYKIISFKENEITLLLNHASYLKEQRLRITHRSAEKIQPFPLELWRYVKHVTVNDSLIAYRNFNRIMRGPMYLNSFHCSHGSFKGVTGLINSDHIFSLKILTGLSNPGFLHKLPQSSIQSLVTVRASCCNENSFLPLMSELRHLKSTTTLSLYCTIFPDAPSVRVPVKNLTISICKHATLDCFKPRSKRLQTLRIGPEGAYINDYEDEMDNDFDYNIDDFLSTALNLRELTMKKVTYSRDSLIATLQVAKTLRKLRVVTFEHGEAHENFPETENLSFNFRNGRLRTITYEDNNFGEKSHPFDWIMAELFDMASFKVKTAFIESFFGVVGGVKMEYIRKGNSIRTREEYDRNDETTDSEYYHQF